MDYRVKQALAEGDRYGLEQRGEEFAPFCQLVHSKQSVNALEIGYRRGGTLVVWHQLCSGTVIGIDIAEAREWSEKRKAELEETYPRLRCVLGDSHDPATAAKVDWLKYDLIFVDGDHSYDGVRKDFDMYSPMLAKDGWVAFHDIQPNPDTLGVNRFWSEMRTIYPHMEFNVMGPWGGIGVLM